MVDLNSQVASPQRIPDGFLPRELRDGVRSGQGVATEAPPAQAGPEAPQPVERGGESGPARERGRFDRGEEASRTRERGQFDRKNLQEAARDINQIVEATNSRIRFNVTDDNKLQVQIVDVETGDVIKSIPPEKLMEIARRIEEAIGLIIDETA